MLRATKTGWILASSETETGMWYFLRVLNQSVTAILLLSTSERVSYLGDASDVYMGVSVFIFGRDSRLFCSCLWLLLSNLGWCWYRTLGPGREFVRPDSFHFIIYRPSLHPIFSYFQRHYLSQIHSY
jgi:hypothetical protein